MTKIVCISDTHGLHDMMRKELPEGDILIHAGDMTHRGKRKEIEDFNNWLGKIKNRFKHILLIAGNHDFLFEDDPNEARGMITNATYIENETIEVEGLKIFGSPITPWYFDWAFNRQRGVEIRQYWKQIPYDVDIVIAHYPFHGTLDKTKNGEHVGCKDLEEKLKSLPKLKLFVCGHIHEDYGVKEYDKFNVVNASICDLRYNPINEPVVVQV